MRGIPKDQSLKRKVIHRLKIAHGHLNKVINMVENDEYCIDVVNQSMAVQKALKSTDNLILKDHLTNCVPHSISNNNLDKSVDEIIKVLEKI